MQKDALELRFSSIKPPISDILCDSLDTNRPLVKDPVIDAD